MNREKFGSFVAMLRKEKGLTQKELAEQLFISNKAVSKWETGASVPDIGLLIPLATLLDVTVTELLMGERLEENSILNIAQVEEVVQTTVSYSDTQIRVYQTKSRWGYFYILSLILSVLEFVFLYRHGYVSIRVITSILLGICFGFYFCFFAKTKLPAYYDENQISVYSDGIFNINIPYVYFNNRNWGKILKIGQIWSILLMSLYPVISYSIFLIFHEFSEQIDIFLCLGFTLGGLFIPISIVGKKGKIFSK